MTGKETTWGDQQPNSQLKRLQAIKNILNKEPSNDCSTKRQFWTLLFTNNGQEQKVVQKADEDTTLNNSTFLKSSDVIQSDADRVLLEAIENNTLLAGIITSSCDTDAIVEQMSYQGLLNLAHFSLDHEEDDWVIRQLVFPGILRLQEEMPKQLSDVTEALLQRNETLTVEHLVVCAVQQRRWPDLLVQLVEKHVTKPSSYASIANAILSNKDDLPDTHVTLLQNLVDKSDMRQHEFPMILARIVSVQGQRQAGNLKFGKLLVSALKKMPSVLRSKQHDLFSQAVSMHKTFLKKAAEVELKNRQVS